MTEIIEKRTYSLKDISLIMGISRSTVCKMVSDNKLPTITIGKNKKVIMKDAFDQWVIDKTNKVN